MPKEAALALAHAGWAAALNEGIALVEAGNLAAALPQLSNAIALSAHFHPLFHFIESSLHTKRAAFRAASDNKEGLIADITRALFLDHINAAMLQAKQQMDAGNWPVAINPETYDSAPKNLSEWLGNSPSLRGGNADEAITEESMFDIIAAAHDEISFARAVELVDATHKQYHQLAAQPWLWRARAHHALGEADLAKNDWRRAWDLDPTIPTLECHPVA